MNFMGDKLFFILLGIKYFARYLILPTNKVCGRGQTGTFSLIHHIGGNFCMAGNRRASFLTIDITMFLMFFYYGLLLINANFSSVWLTKDVQTSKSASLISKSLVAVSTKILISSETKIVLTTMN